MRCGHHDHSGEAYMFYAYMFYERFHVDDLGMSQHRKQRNPIQLLLQKNMVFAMDYILLPHNKADFTCVLHLA